MVVIKPKFEKSVIRWLGRHENTAIEIITMTVFFFGLQRFFVRGMLGYAVKKSLWKACEE
jgi:hypothetical protein